jgi:hypothetical protein
LYTYTQIVSEILVYDITLGMNSSYVDDDDNDYDNNDDDDDDNNNNNNNLMVCLFLQTLY